MPKKIEIKKMVREILLDELKKKGIYASHKGSTLVIQNFPGSPKIEIVDFNICLRFIAHSDNFGRRDYDEMIFNLGDDYMKPGVDVSNPISRCVKTITKMFRALKECDNSEEFFDPCIPVPIGTAKKLVKEMIAECKVKRDKINIMSNRDTHYIYIEKIEESDPKRKYLDIGIAHMERNKVVWYQYDDEKDDYTKLNTKQIKTEIRKLVK